jgi:hypothetical protein
MCCLASSYPFEHDERYIKETLIFVYILSIRTASVNHVREDSNNQRASKSQSPDPLDVWMGFGCSAGSGIAQVKR